MHDIIGFFNASEKCIFSATAARHSMLLNLSQFVNGLNAQRINVGDQNIWASSRIYLE
ncbi:hypothetical protein Plhal304r1_c012g0048191 [Plasmopara halstedii]